MRRARLYVEGRLPAAGRIELDGAAAHHIARVLRLRAGAPLVVFDGEGAQYSATLAAATKRGATIELGEPLPANCESPLSVTLVQGVSRGERMDFVMQKATELGVAAITPVLTERSVVRLDGERAERRMAHWRRIVIGACEQSGRTRLPALAAPVAFDDWLVSQSPDGTRLLLHPGAAASLAEVARPADSQVTVAVGPEGGFSPRERDLLLQRGYCGVHLGPRTLRTETAALAVLAMLQSNWGDLG